VSAYDARPWLALYGDQPADYDIEFDNALDMFRAGLAKDPGGDAVGVLPGHGVGHRRRPAFLRSRAVQAWEALHAFSRPERRYRFPCLGMPGASQVT
jgi:hypothetical protein